MHRLLTNNLEQLPVSIVYTCSPNNSTLTQHLILRSMIVKKCLCCNETSKIPEKVHNIM